MGEHAPVGEHLEIWCPRERRKLHVGPSHVAPLSFWLFLTSIFWWWRGNLVRNISIGFCFSYTSDLIKPKVEVFGTLVIYSWLVVPGWWLKPAAGIWSGGRGGFWRTEPLPYGIWHCFQVNRVRIVFICRTPCHNVSATGVQWCAESVLKARW